MPVCALRLRRLNLDVRRMAFSYRFAADAAYYRIVIDRYYRQLPVVLWLPVQFSFLAAISIGGFALVTDATWTSAPIALIAGAAIVVGGTTLTKQGILLKYRIRPSFGKDSSFSVDGDGVVGLGTNSATPVPWNHYRRAVRYSDGILLLRPGAIRWLPDAALTEGTSSDITALVASKLPLRTIA